VPCSCATPCGRPNSPPDDHPYSEDHPYTDADAYADAYADSDRYADHHAHPDPDPDARHPGQGAAMSEPEHETEFSDRPWGGYTVLDESAADHKVKRLVVHPGKRLSYQRHAHRSEHWFLVSGTARVTLDDTVTELGPGQAIDIPLNAAHRIANCGDDDVVFIEVQRGTYFGEDDIIRIEDDFGRADPDPDPDHTDPDPGTPASPA
jgi:mannose-6-phosphate isomerase